MLAAAVTIHKSQGMTLDKVLLDLAGRDFSAGLSYVALSRVRRITDLAFEGPLSYDRFPSNPPAAVVARMQDAKERQEQQERQEDDSRTEQTGSS